MDAAPKLGAPRAMPQLPQMGEASGAAGGQMPFDPSQIDPAMMAQMNTALQRLPKGQLQRLQSMMQRAMAGKDISREAAELERTLPPDFQAMMKGFSMPGASGESALPQALPATPSTAPASEDMSVIEARKIVEAAVAEGKVSKEQAENLLKNAPEGEPEAKGFAKLWRGMTGKTDKK
jgi:hypothetical protein